MKSANGDYVMEGNYRGVARQHADARLIAAAPAMYLALDMISFGIARIERHGRLVEFCFDGIRYSHNGDWGAMLDVIGWGKARAALASALASAQGGAA